MPRYEERKAINICFVKHKIMNQSKYEELKSRYGEPEDSYRPLNKLTVIGRLFIPPYFNEFNNSYDALKYVVRDNTCHHTKFGNDLYIRRRDTEKILETIEIDPDFLPNVKWMSVFISPVSRYSYKLVSNCGFTDDLNGTETNLTEVDLQAYMFKVNKPPYVDNYVDYQSRGFMDREDAIEEYSQSLCINHRNILAVEKVNTVDIEYVNAIRDNKYKRYCEN